MFSRLTDFDTKRYEVIDTIKNDIAAADLKITLLIIACRSKHTLKTVTEKQCNTDRKCFLDILNSIPGIPMLLHIYRHPTILCGNDRNSLDFIHWLMVVRCDPKITSISGDYKELLRLHSEIQEINLIPDYIFQVDYCRSTKDSARWSEWKSRFTLKYGFRAIKVEDCFLTLFSGTDTPGNKIPICLYSNLNESFSQVYFKNSWGRSTLGFSLKILLLTEFIDHPTLVSVCLHGKKIQKTYANYNVGLEGKKFLIADPKLARYAYILMFKKPAHPECCRVLYLTFYLVILLTCLIGAILIISTVKINAPTTITY